MNLKDKVIIITGASDGIGKQIALRLAKEGPQLALIARDEERLNGVKAEAEKLGAGSVRVYPVNICLTEQLREVVKQIVSDFKVVDILINNAGIWQKLGPLDEIKTEDIDEIINTNLTALIHLTRFVLPILKVNEEAAILNICSKSGVVAQAGQSVYTASKYGVRGFTEVLKVDLKDTNVKVAGVYQSGTNTNMFKKAGDDFSTDNFTNPADLADLIAYILSRPEKIWLHDVQIDH